MIKKHLDLIAQKENANFEEASSITEVKLLLQQNESEDLSFIQNAFPNSSNSRLIENNIDKEQVKSLSTLHDGDVFTAEQIKSICMKYRLRFLPSQLYKGNLPIDVLHDVKRKIETTDKLKYLSSGSSLLYERNIFMMAPVSMFNIEGTMKKKKAELAEIKRLRELDPAVFIKVEENKYLFVREFGNSFSFLRRILGALTAKTNTFNLLFFISWLAGIYLYKKLIITPLFQYHHLITENNPKEFAIALLIIILICTGIVFFVGAALSGESSFILSWIKEYKKGWFRIDKEFSTEHNWNQI